LGVVAVKQDPGMIVLDRHLNPPKPVQKTAVPRRLAGDAATYAKATRIKYEEINRLIDQMLT
jgi:hypothetical protein